MKKRKYINMIGRQVRKIKIFKNKLRYHKQFKEKVSVISSNCLGGVVLHDFGLPFNSPTVNLFFPAEDYLKFLTNLEAMTDAESVRIEDITTKNSPYPVALLNDIVKVNLMHYKNFEAGKEAYLRRCRRINFNNLRIIMTERDGCTEQQINQFDTLPFKHKVIFMKKKRNHIASGVYVPGYENEPQLSNLMDNYTLLGRREYDKTIDWFQFIKNGLIKVTVQLGH